MASFGPWRRSRFFAILEIVALCLRLQKRSSPARNQNLPLVNGHWLRLLSTLFRPRISAITMLKGENGKGAMRSVIAWYQSWYKITALQSPYIMVDNYLSERPGPTKFYPSSRWENVLSAFFKLYVQRDAHDFMRFSFYFWSFTEIADIYFFLVY